MVLSMTSLNMVPKPPHQVNTKLKVYSKVTLSKENPLVLAENNSPDKVLWQI